MCSEISVINSVDTFKVGDQTYSYYPIRSIEGAESLPYSLSVLLENVIRNARSDEEATLYATRIIEAAKAKNSGEEIEFSPARVLFQDFTGVPVFVDFAVMREACVELGGDPSKINPLVPCDLVIDHSVIADIAGCSSAQVQNEQLEFERNQERYSFLKWAQNSFDNVRIVPPGQGICHQLNIEKLASVVMQGAVEENGSTPVYFDTVVGTDSHTPTVNGIGVLGWGVGGIEAEAAALGQPITTLVPKVVGVELIGKLQEGVSAMDVALTFAEMLREVGVVGCFVECFGEGVASLSATQRSCISNMTPEYGCTCTLFPVDEQTIDYLRLTGRDKADVALVEAYAKAQGFWNDGQRRNYSQVLSLDLSTVKRSVAGPARPHDRMDFERVQDHFHQICKQRNLDLTKMVTVDLFGSTYELHSGAIAIAAVTSCTTATDPSMMIACGLLAKNAAAKGLKAKPWVKTILAPGSHGVNLLLERSGLLDGLQEVGFYTCGFGCMSCIGNSGPLPEALHAVSGDIELASVLSGNRNFEGRISPDVSQNYLMAPAAVVAYALAGTIDFDMEHQPLGKDASGNEIYLRDIWPSSQQIQELLDEVLTPELYAESTKSLFEGSAAWKELEAFESDLFQWNEDSTYVRAAPYFQGMGTTPAAPQSIENARILALLGDFITTDHISPAGTFAADSPAGCYLQEHGVEPSQFNTYGSRRGNHEVLMRGTFANIKLQNKLAKEKRGGWTYNFLAEKIAPIYETAMDYAKSDVPAVVVAGKMYGSGSSRDWAAKGPLLLGVKAVIAQSYERIHRSNLIGMGILPLQFKEGESADTLGLNGNELITIGQVDFSSGLPQPASVKVTALAPDGREQTFEVDVRIDTATEGCYFTHGGILPYVLRSLQ